MASYKLLSLIQAIVMFFCGWSVFEFGYEIAALGTILSGTDPSGPFPILNDLLFPEDGGGDYWNGFAYWGYSMIVVGILQIFKGLTAESI